MVLLWHINDQKYCTRCWGHLGTYSSQDYNATNMHKHYGCLCELMRGRIQVTVASRRLAGFWCMLLSLPAPLAFAELFASRAAAAAFCDHVVTNYPAMTSYTAQSCHAKLEIGHRQWCKKPGALWNCLGTILSILLGPRVCERIAKSTATSISTAGASRTLAKGTSSTVLTGLSKTFSGDCDCVHVMPKTLKHKPNPRPETPKSHDKT